MASCTWKPSAEPTNPGLGSRDGPTHNERVPHVKRILCLANSRKLSGRCVAGREFDGHVAGPWVRPVSAREHEEVSEYERQYEDGSDPQVLDVIDVPVREARPAGHQTENWLLDPEYYWSRVERVAPPDVRRFVEPPASLWIDGQSTYAGKNDEIPLSLLSGVESSLRLIRVDALTLTVFAPREAFGSAKRRVQGRFEHAGSRYALWVTDPTWERRYLAQSDGSYEIGECCLTISLGEPFRDACYKLIAAVIPLA